VRCSRLSIPDILKYDAINSIRVGKITVVTQLIVYPKKNKDAAG